MMKLIFYLIFIISVALTSGGIILTSRIRNRFRSEVFSTLLYFQVFIYTFGFYGIWGQVAVKTLLRDIMSPANLSKLADIAILLGLPFLIIAWLMLIRFAEGLSGRKDHKWFIIWFLLFNFAALTAMGYYITGSSSFDNTMLIKEYYILMNLFYHFIAAYLIHFPWKGHQIVHDYDRRVIAPALFLIMLVQCVPLFFYTTQTWLAVIFIFVFFLGNTFLPVYLNYCTLLPANASETGTAIPVEEFCRKFDVSPRELDVIREICNGLSNKEISEKLFISLQTVKDHTHRIYVKTNVKNRVQLINSLKSFQKQ
ncbi:MAG TPA: LuxR C-terminal-related transcriptional regulator [Bacteroidales bacterium]|jgi:DNA-binding CsgD family transcriptional regulator|nr:LuxR C-terminal-related transcriptional regulator [Bacteroidales bacterium]